MFFPENIDVGDGHDVEHAFDFYGGVLIDKDAVCKILRAVFCFFAVGSDRLAAVGEKGRVVLIPRVALGVNFQHRSVI